MSSEDWARLEALVRLAAEETPTLARANGLAIARLLDAVEPRSAPGPLDWQEWERQKTLRLLR